MCDYAPQQAMQTDVVFQSDYFFNVKQTSPHSPLIHTFSMCMDTRTRLTTSTERMLKLAHARTCQDTSKVAASSSAAMMYAVNLQSSCERELDFPPTRTYAHTRATSAHVRESAPTQQTVAPANTAATPDPSAPAPDLRSAGEPAEEMVGPFILGGVLGRGCTGIVRLGTHKDTDFKVAFKIIKKKYLNSKPDLWSKVKREIAILKLIEHPHVLKLFDVYETPNTLYLVLENVMGGELFDYIISKGRLERHQALKFAAQIVMGLEHCQARSICHRDLKPENLLLDADNNIKIADFGMAQLMKQDNFLNTSCGSPHYASPEIINGGAYDGKQTDVWSMGVILFALVTGSLPFDSDNISVLLAAVTKGRYQVPSYVDADVKDLISKLLVVDPNQRMALRDIRHHPVFQNTGE